MSRRSPYSTVDVNRVVLEPILATRAGQRCVVGVDVAKRRHVACLYWGGSRFESPWRMHAWEDLGVFIDLLQQLRRHCPLKVAMESSGTYGDALRQALGAAGIELELVSGRAVRHHSETFDGVPSQHDGKDSAVIADLCWTGKGKPWAWRVADEVDQELRYQVRRLDALHRIGSIWSGKLEAQLARHWPEASGLLNLTGATLLRLLDRWGSPAALAADASAAELLRKMGGYFLKPEKIEAVLRSARATRGVALGRWEVLELRETAGHLLGLRRQIATVKRSLRRLASERPEIVAQAPAIGMVCACVMWVCLGSPRNYSSAGAYRKAMGLNLREESSGAQQGRLKLTKRGPRLVRKWLFFSALRLASDPRVKPWMDAKADRDGGVRIKALVGVMRRLALAAWHVGHTGEVFDPGRLFSVGREVAVP